VSDLNLLVGKPVSLDNTWAYHMTGKACLKNIQRFGLLPQLNTSGFGPMSKELQPLREVPKIFFLRSLTNGSYAGFLKEWWRESPCVVLRIPIAALQSPQESFDPDLARHEMWSFQAVPSQFIQFAGLPRPKWIKLTDLRFE
jgi:hypothetical protein